MAEQLELQIEQALDQAGAGAAATSPIRSDGPLVLFGAGQVGMVALAGLRKIGIEPAAWADNNPRVQGTVVEGVPVLSPQEAAAKFGGAATFVVTIYTGAGVRQQLSQMGLRVVSFGKLFHQFHEAFLPYCCLDLPSKMARHRQDILKGAQIWADEASRREYLAQVRYRAVFDEHVPPPNSGSMYFPDDLVKLTQDELFIDCGAYDGDTLRSFLDRCSNSFRQIVALEPDAANFAQLQAFVAKLPNNVRDKIHLEQVAIGSRPSTVRFEASGSVSSHVTAAGGYEVRSLPLDDVLADFGASLIKMDIEGSEADALRGAANIIRAHLPVLSICLYHRQEDLWQIPLLIASLSDQYRLFLRRHSDDCWEQICHAIPVGRLLK